MVYTLFRFSRNNFTNCAISSSRCPSSVLIVPTSTLLVFSARNPNCIRCISSLSKRSLLLLFRFNSLISKPFMSFRFSALHTIFKDQLMQKKVGRPNIKIGILMFDLHINLLPRKVFEEIHIGAVFYISQDQSIFSITHQNVFVRFAIK